jgi:hypothetical protein
MVEMTLRATRETFVKYSGRYDLVVDTTNWADNGANFFIRAGQKWLDSRFLIARSKGVFFQYIGTGSWYVIIPSARVVHSVWLSDAANIRWEVKRTSVSLLREMFPGDLAQISPDIPQFYAPIALHAIPEVLDTITVDQLGQTGYTVTGDIFNFNGIVFGPPTEKEMTIEVTGMFYQPRLNDDTDENYWTKEFENVLAMAACRELEISYRNTAGINDWENSIKSELLGEEFDLADTESAGIRQMEG